ncbi:hypothetical protein [Hyphomicrobium sp. ghe19]|uniref:hypothetical protein n=1 Tax=Hyphomicrobium sp. ghe19 TaxID=2682968 RepID=UPI0013676758|nr:hypothetical protein HYPP_04279 [Hyphomicrobium sp. ghe19]
MADTPKIRVANVWAAISMAAAPIFNFVCSRLTRSPAKEMPRQVGSRRIEPPRLSISEQWGHISGIITGAASRAEEATRCHASATLQLDLAQYALTSLVDELTAVMDVGGRRRRATVHVLGIAPPSSPRPTMGDAIAA